MAAITAAIAKQGEDRGNRKQAALHEPEFRAAARVQRSFTAAAEKRILLWIAARLPMWVTADQLTCLGFAGTALGCASYVLARWYRAGYLLAALSLAINWFGDSLDGTIARVRNQQRPRYGFYVDHVLDSLGAAMLMGGLGASGAMDWRIAAAMLTGFLLLSIDSYLAAYTLGEFHMSVWKFGPTEIRILLGAADLMLWLDPRKMIVHGMWLMDLGGAIAAGLMLLMFFASAARHTARLYRQEALPAASSSAARTRPLGRCGFRFPRRRSIISD